MEGVSPLTQGDVINDLQWRIVAARQAGIYIQAINIPGGACVVCSGPIELLAAAMDIFLTDDEKGDPDKLLDRDRPGLFRFQVVVIKIAGAIH